MSEIKAIFLWYVNNIDFNAIDCDNYMFVI